MQVSWRILQIWLRKEKLRLINTIEILLKDEEYNLKELDKRIILFKENSGFSPEDFIEIKKNDSTGKFIVSEVHRDVRQTKLETERKEKAAICAVVFYKKLFDDIVDRMVARRIRNYINSGENEKALSCSIERFDDSLYSIGYEEILKISLIQSEDKVDIKYGGKYLAESATISRGYVVLYNYCEKLRHISSFCNQIQSRLKCSIDRKKIIEWYIF